MAAFCKLDNFQNGQISPEKLHISLYPMPGSNMLKALGANKQDRPNLSLGQNFIHA